MQLHYITEQQQLLDNVIPKVHSQPAWGIDTETTGLDPHTDKVILLQIGNTEEQFIIDARKVKLDPLKPWLESVNYFKYGHNLKFDYKMVKGSTRIEMERLRDTYLGEKILTNGLKFSGFGLGDLVKSYLDVELPNKKEMQESFINHQGDFSKEQLEYAANDVKYIIPLKQKITKELSSKGLADTFVLECEAIPSFGDMEFEGLNLDTKKWAALADENLAKAKELIPKMNWFAKQAKPEFLNKYGDMFGDVHVNYGSPDQVVELLQGLNIKLRHYTNEERGEYVEKVITDSKDKTLKQIDAPIVKLLKQYRSLMVMSSTFGYSFINAVHKKTGRIHMDLAQIGTETGRIAAGHSPVNMLNIPRDKRMRNCFIADDDYVIETHDYSGCELRIWAHISQDPELCKALREHIDLHCHVASKLYGVEVVKGTENYKLRTPAKSLNFGIAYGMAAYALYMKLNGDGFPITFKEAEALYYKYCKEFSTGVNYLRSQGKLAIKNGYLENMNGRRRHWLIPNYNDLQKYPLGFNDRSYRGRIGGIQREGGNFKIQSVNADLTKYAMTMLRRYIKQNKIRSNIILQVYDEIVTHTHKNDSADFILAKEKIMIEAASRWIDSVPIEVEGTVQPYWTK